MAVEVRPKTLDEARAALADEWRAADPQTPEQIAAFYRHAGGLEDDLNAWHETDMRRAWTHAAVGVARQIGAQLVVDIGCGAGHDLRAMRDAGIGVIGVEPNDTLRECLQDEGFSVSTGVEHESAIEQADLLCCFDVLEHVPDPEAFLDGIAARAKLGCVLLETTATHDAGTPLHLESSRGWHPGRALERRGWKLHEQKDRFRAWVRLRGSAAKQAGLLVCGYRQISVRTVNSILALAGISGRLSRPDAPGLVARTVPTESAWRVVIHAGDAEISRARSVIVSRWWAECADDVFLMLDDDIAFDPKDAERIVERCRQGYPILCGGYPVGDASHLAFRRDGRADPIRFAPDAEPIRIEYASTGFLAVHRKVIDALVPTLPLCHGEEPFAFWPMFQPFPTRLGSQVAYLSEDWSFSHRAREVGFESWLDPSIRLGHLKQFEVTVTNMELFHAAGKTP